MVISLFVCLFVCLFVNIMLIINFTHLLQNNKHLEEITDIVNVTIL